MGLSLTECLEVPLTLLYIVKNQKYLTIYLDHKYIWIQFQIQRQDEWTKQVRPTRFP